MRILFNDVIQKAKINSHFSLINETDKLKSPILSEIFRLPIHLNVETGLLYYQYFDIVFDKITPINSIGIGNTDTNNLSLDITHIVNELEIISSITIPISGNGLYFISDRNYNRPYNVKKITVISENMNDIDKTNATYIGRLAAGIGVKIPTSLRKEPGFNSTATSRVTISGQMIPGLGGYNYKTLSLDSRYKIDELAMKEIENGYEYIGKDYPYFIDLTDESYKLPFNKMYATEKNQKAFRFEGGISKYLYSRRWEFEERF